MKNDAVTKYVLERVENMKAQHYSLLLTVFLNTGHPYNLCVADVLL